MHFCPALPAVDKTAAQIVALGPSVAAVLHDFLHFAVCLLGDNGGDSALNSDGVGLGAAVCPARFFVWGVEVDPGIALTSQDFIHLGVAHGRAAPPPDTSGFHLGQQGGEAGAIQGALIHTSNPGGLDFIYNVALVYDVVPEGGYTAGMKALVGGFGQPLGDLGPQVINVIFRQRPHHGSHEFTLAVLSEILGNGHKAHTPLV